MKNCFKCGMQNTDDFNFCGKCGNLLDVDAFEPAAQVTVTYKRKHKALGLIMLLTTLIVGLTITILVVWNIQKRSSGLDGASNINVNALAKSQKTAANSEERDKAKALLDKKDYKGAYDAALNILNNVKEPEDFVSDVRKIFETAKTKRLDEFKNKITIKTDKLANANFIYAKTTKKEIDNFNCYAYISQNLDGSGSTLRYVAGFSQDDWIFTDVIRMVSNKGSFSRIFEIWEVETDVFSGGKIIEWVDVDLKNYQIDDLRNTVAGGTVDIRFKGKYHLDKKLSAKQVEAFRTIIDYYRILNP